MKMPLLKVDKFLVEEQTRKISEELDEFINSTIGSDEELLEALDLIQSTITYISHVHKKDNIEWAIKEHYNKFINEREWDTKGTIKIELEDK